MASARHNEQITMVGELLGFTGSLQKELVCLTHTRTHTHTHLHTHAYAHTHTCTRTHICMHTCNKNASCSAMKQNVSKETIVVIAVSHVTPRFSSLYKPALLVLIFRWVHLWPQRHQVLAGERQGPQSHDQCSPGTQKSHTQPHSQDADPEACRAEEQMRDLF